MNDITSESIANIEDSDIDLGETISSLIRQKIYILGVSSISLLLGLIYSSSLKPVWEGQFQIVIKIAICI